MIKIELAYKTQKISLTVAEKLSIDVAIKDQPLYQKYLSEVSTPHVGVFGKEVSLDHILTEGERIELYLPLLCDPMVKRKEKVKRAKKKP